MLQIFPKTSPTFGDTFAAYDGHGAVGDGGKNPRCKGDAVIAPCIDDAAFDSPREYCKNILFITAFDAQGGEHSLCGSDAIALFVSQTLHPR